MSERRFIVLDTETTGLEPRDGHRIIEIGCVEVINRRLSGNNFHQYLNPDRDIDEAAIEVHGITTEQLQDKPRFPDIAERLLAYLKDAELVIHNAAFDVGFLNHEYQLAGYGEGCINSHCEITDSLLLARKKHPGQKNNLDALCQRYEVNNSQRTLHGALLDAEILADVYLQMTGGQISLWGDVIQSLSSTSEDQVNTAIQYQPTPVIAATAAELADHQKWLALLNDSSDGAALWNQYLANGHETDLERD